MRIGIDKGSEVEGDSPITAAKMLFAKPHTASRRKAKAERFCCRHVWIADAVMTWACAASVRAVAAEDFAIADRQPQGLLGQVVGGRVPWLQQEQEPFRTMLVQMACKRLVQRIAAWPNRETVEVVAVHLESGFEIGAVQFALVVGITDVEGSLHQVDDLTRKSLFLPVKFSSSLWARCSG